LQAWVPQYARRASTRIPVPATNGVLPHDLGDGEEHVAVDAERRARLQRERDQPGGASASCGLTPGAQELPSRAGRARG